MARAAVLLVVALAAFAQSLRGQPGCQKPLNLPAPVAQEIKAPDIIDDPLPDGALYRLGTTRLRHRLVNDLRFDAAGRLITQDWRSKEALIWDAASGKLVAKQPSSSARFSPDRKLLAELDDGDPIIKDVDSGKTRHRLDVGAIAIDWAFAADGQTLTVLTKTNAVKRFDVKTGKKLSQHSFALAERSSFGDPPVSLSPDGATLAGVLRAEGDKTKVSYPLRFWDTATGKERRHIVMSASLYSCRWSPDSTRILALLRPYALEIWDVSAGKRLERRPQRVSTAVFAPDSRRVIIGDVNQVRLYDPDRDETVWRRTVAPFAMGSPMKASMVNAFGFHPRDKTMAVGCTCGHIALLDWTTGADAAFSRGRPGSFRGPIHFSPDGRTFLVQSALAWPEWTLRETATGKVIRSLDGQQRAQAWVPNTNLLAVYEWTKADKDLLHVLDASTGKKLWTREHDDAPLFSSDGKFWAFHDSQSAHLADVATGKVTRSFRLPADKDARTAANIRAFLPDLGLLAAEARAYRELQLWDMDGKKRWTWQAPRAWESWSVLFLPGGKHLLAYLRDPKKPTENVHVLDVASGKQLRAFEASAGLMNLYPSPDGRFVLEGSLYEIKMRDVVSGRLIEGIEFGAWLSAAYAFAPNGAFIAFRSRNCVEIRATATGKLLNKTAPLSDFIMHVTVAPDNRTVAIACNDSTVLLWDATGKPMK